MSKLVGVWTKLHADKVFGSYEGIEDIEHSLRTHGWTIHEVSKERRGEVKKFFVEDMGEEDYIDSVNGFFVIDEKIIEIDVTLDNVQRITNPYVHADLCILKGVELLSTHDIVELGLHNHARTSEEGLER